MGMPMSQWIYKILMPPNPHSLNKNAYRVRSLDELVSKRGGGEKVGLLLRCVLGR